MNTVADLLNQARKFSNKKFYRDLELLMCHSIKKPRAWLYSHSDYLIGNPEAEDFLNLARSRISGTPIAYLVGRREFWSLTFKVNRYTLIPRPETELLVECALELNLPRNAKVLDLGTGSGAIALALAFERPEWQILATDCSEEALSVARFNSIQLGLKQVSFLKSDWYESVLAKGCWDLIISNPPYVDLDYLNANRTDLNFEPEIALLADDAGFSELRKIVVEASNYLNHSGFLILEHGYDQRYKVTKQLELAGFSDIKTEKDLAGIDRTTFGRHFVK